MENYYCYEMVDNRNQELRQNLLGPESDPEFLKNKFILDFLPMINEIIWVFSEDNLQEYIDSGFLDCGVDVNLFLTIASYHGEFDKWFLMIEITTLSGDSLEGMGCQKKNYHMTYSATKKAIFKETRKLIEVTRIIKNSVYPGIYKDLSGRTYFENELNFLGESEIVKDLYRARDKNGDIRIHFLEPSRNEEDGVWEGPVGMSTILPNKIFPDLTCESDPEQVEITIKRKKK